jgi:peptide/nickel transport system substrate-binding protein
MSDPRVDDLLRQFTAGSISRRQLLKRTAALGLSVPVVMTLLAACGDDDDVDDTAPPVDEPDDDDAVEPTDDDDDEPVDEPDDDDDDEPVDEPGEYGGILNMSTTLGDSGVSNPILTGSEYWANWIAFNRLFKYDDYGEVLHELGETFDISDDGMTWTFHLREASWHDGEPFSADDVVFTFDTIQDDATDTGFGSRLRVAGQWVEWSAVDDRTLEIVTPEPFGPFLFALSQIAIIPRHVLEDSDDINTDAFNTNPIGTGPFRWVERQPDQWIRYERFDDYWDGPPAADGYTIFFMSDTEAASAALDTGEIDYMFAPPELQPRYMDDPEVRVLQYVYFTPITLSFNHRHPILAELDVRRAIAHAIDKPSLMETVTLGLGILANNQYAQTAPLLDQFNDYDRVNYMEAYPYDPEGAGQILDEAGFVMGDDGVRARDGERMSFQLLTYAGFDEYLNAQEIIQSMLSDVGIEVSLDVLEYTTLQGLWHDPEGDPADRSMEVQEWPHPFEMDPDVYDELHSDSQPPGGDNYMYFVDEEVDRLIDQGRQTAELEDRVPIYRDLDVRRMETLPTLPLYCAVDARLFSRRVESRNQNNPLDDTPSSRWYERAFPEDLYKPNG